MNGQYRTLTGQGNTALGGSSYGGVATLYALLARPQTFGYGLIESPSIWVGMGQLIRDTSPLAAVPRKVFVKAAGYGDGNFRYVYEQVAKHTESAWAKRLPDAMKFLFADGKPSPPAQAIDE